MGLDTKCDKLKCPGPLKYYEGLQCNPVYKNSKDCCPQRYDCEHLKMKPKNKCFVNGHEYSIGDSLSDEDAHPCDKHCKCVEKDGL